MLAKLRSTLRRQWIGASLGMLALFVALGGAAVVAQDGGDSGEVRACILQSASGGSQANVRIVGDNESCPSNSTPRNWNVRGPIGPQGPEGPPSDIGSSDPPTTGEIAAGVGANLPATIKRVKHSDGPARYKSVTSPRCPNSHPRFFGGGYEVRGANREGVFHLFANGPIYVPAGGRSVVPRWHVAAAGQPIEGAEGWRLTAYILCRTRG